MKSIYHKLRELLDTHPSGCPETPEILEILKKLFSEDEAAVILGMGFRPFTAGEIASRSGVDEKTAKERLERLAGRGLVYSREKNGEWGYSLLAVMPGIFEFPYMKENLDDISVDLIPLWKQYLPSLMKNMGESSTGFSRVIPIQEEVESASGAMPYHKVYNMIDSARSVGIARCACRVMEKKCDGPIEACMVFDETCDFLVHRGLAKYLSKKEMKEKLIEFEKAGLVHNTGNTQDKLAFICNCCACCCGLLRSAIEYRELNIVSESGFTPELDRDLCIACEHCLLRCPTEAVSIEDGFPRFRIEKCIGCGLCVTGCESEALKLVFKSDTSAPPANAKEMALSKLGERGKVSEFLELLKPDGKTIDRM